MIRNQQYNGVKNFYSAQKGRIKSERELNHDILKITMAIEELFPELSKYIAEMPIKISDNYGAGVNSKNLQDYYDTLDAFLKKYSAYHVRELPSPGIS